jgi:hypothetical protein
MAAALSQPRTTIVQSEQIKGGKEIFTCAKKDRRDGECSSSQAGLQILLDERDPATIRPLPIGGCKAVPFTPNGSARPCLGPAPKPSSDSGKAGSTLSACRSR